MKNNAKNIAKEFGKITPSHFVYTRAILPCAILIVISLFSSCALPIQARTVANRFDSPEASGKRWKGHVEGGVEGGPDFYMTPDATAVPVNLANPYFERSDWDGFISGGLGITDRMDIDIKTRFNSDSIIQAKYQFLGDTRINAKEGSFSLAGTIGFGGSTTANASLGDDSLAVYSLTSFEYELAVIGGYRFNDHGLIYTSPYVIRRNFSGTISQSNGSSTDFADNLDVWGECVGVQVEVKKFTMKFEYSGAFSSASGATNFGSYGGIALGFFWGGPSQSSVRPQATESASTSSAL